jgi:hypothetical protein
VEHVAPAAAIYATWGQTLDLNRFEAVTRSLTSVPSRRDLLRGLVSVGLGLGAVRITSVVDAKKKRKKRKPKKPKPNEFGCLEVGDPCQTEEQCCSGICDGKKGKRKCRAHDTETCEQDRPGYCEAGNPYLALCHGGDANCFRTTAGSKVCSHNLLCADCRRDADCEALGYPPGTACAPLGGDYSCADVCEVDMACVIPVGLAPEA